ncbi:integrase arm-type DNA-binding domain-containing protein [Psychrobacter sp. PP-21]|uniref:tyrosine-type recombinase/integrase n=1 Tax=Psychrobacter sp. PP-21 TaxID=2957503 RepID=UPI0029ACDBE6|nr:integrase arm-type DNA-binding domain-containing protein [Psychrobacter sp. PP-21]MDX2374311.1 integrase arm-type DNA-binding domain-containing protein [Psychrobacter sp. PP-21]
MAVDHANDINKLEYRDKDYSVSVSGVAGLSIRVYPNGKKEYYLRYSHPHIEGKRPRMMLGKVEDIDLYEVKYKAETILNMVAKGSDPKAIQQKEQVNRYTHLKNATFSEIAQAWRDHKTAGRHQNKSKRSAFSDSTLKFWDLCLGYMCSEIGDLRMNDITSEMILSVCESIQNNDNQATFVGASTRLYTEKVFSFAVARGLCDRNVAIDTRGELAPANSGNHLPAITKPDQFATLLKDMSEFKGASKITLEAMNLLPYVFVRSIDLRSMRWDDIDWDTNIWAFSPTKGEGRDDMVSHLVVPLATQVIERLRDIQSITGHKEYVFASMRGSSNAYISKATLVQIFHRLGYKDVQCAHGFRASAKTLLMEQPELRYSDIVTELQLGHRIKDTHGGAYNRLDEIDTRIQMMQDWADYIDELRDR